MELLRKQYRPIFLNGKSLIEQTFSGKEHRALGQLLFRSLSLFTFHEQLALGQIGLPRTHENRNFDARIAYNQDYVAEPTEQQRSALDFSRGQLTTLTARFDQQTGVTRILFNRGDYLTPPNGSEDHLALALGFISSNATALGLSSGDFAQYQVKDEVFSQVTGASHIYFRQVYEGLPVYNGLLHVNVNRDGRIISVNNSFLAEIDLAVNTTLPAIDAATALVNAAKQVGIVSKEQPKLLGRPSGVQQTVQLSAPTITAEPVTAELLLLPIRRGEARLVWNFQLPTKGGDHHYDFTVDAVNGSVWTRIDWVVSEQFLVYPQPVESPIHTSPLPPADGRQTVGIQDPSISPLGWFDTGSTQYTITRGNNVHAYQDGNNSNSSSGDEPDCGPPLDCFFPINLK